MHLTVSSSFCSKNKARSGKVSQENTCCRFCGVLMIVLSSLPTKLVRRLSFAASIDRYLRVLPSSYLEYSTR